MSGHGSDPDEDKSKLTSRLGTRNSGLYSVREMYPNSPVEMRVQEFRPALGSGERLSERGTRYHWNVIHGDYNRSGSVRTLQRAKAAVRSRARRLTQFALGQSEEED